ncbi:MAG: hypothetical protein HYZ81_11250 [Nitrospinae bacterium]|nr:hypothetical protein [Nitrospinota bacterium]
MLRAILPFFIILLVVLPALDLAWNEPVLDQPPGARCQLHATPAVACEPVGLVLGLAAELLLPFEALDHFPMVSPSIFIPPRA